MAQPIRPSYPEPGGEPCWRSAHSSYRPMPTCSGHSSCCCNGFPANVPREDGEDYDLPTHDYSLDEGGSTVVPFAHHLDPHCRHRHLLRSLTILLTASRCLLKIWCWRCIPVTATSLNIVQHLVVSLQPLTAANQQCQPYRNMVTNVAGLHGLDGLPTSQVAVP